MVNIVHIDVNCDDFGKITSLEMKLKDVPREGEQPLEGQLLPATASSAFFKTTLLTDVGKFVKTVVNPKRKNIVNVIVALSDENDISITDVANFIMAFQMGLDDTHLI